MQSNTTKTVISTVYITRRWLFTFIRAIYKFLKLCRKENLAQINYPTTKWPTQFSYEFCSKGSIGITSIKRCNLKTSRSAISLRASAPSKTNDPGKDEYNDYDYSLYYPPLISGPPEGIDGSLDAIISYKGYWLGNLTIIQSLVEITQALNVYIRRCHLYKITDLEMALTRIVNRIIKKRLPRKELVNTMICIGMDMGTGKSYLAKKYPKLFIDIDSLINWESDEVAKLYQGFDPNRINQIDWGSVHEHTGNAIANYHERNGYDNKILLVHNHEALYRAINLRQIKSAYIGELGTAQSDYGNIVDERLSIIPSTEREYTTKMFALNRATSKSVKVGILGRNLTIVNILRLLYSQIN